MKYYLTEIATGAIANGKPSTKAIYEYETQTEAVASFHKKLGTAMASELYDTELVIVFDEMGKMVKREYFARPKPEPEPEEEEVGEIE